MCDFDRGPVPWLGSPPPVSREHTPPPPLGMQARSKGQQEPTPTPNAPNQRASYPVLTLLLFMYGSAEPKKDRGDTKKGPKGAPHSRSQTKDTPQSRHSTPPTPHPTPPTPDPPHRQHLPDPQGTTKPHTPGETTANPPPEERKNQARERG